MSTYKKILPHVALAYIKCSVSPHCYYSTVVKETEKLYAVIVEQPKKKEKHSWITLKANAEIQQLLERMKRYWETNHIWSYHE